jgi:hypothetical protein
VWLVDPVLRTIEVYESSDGRPTLVGTGRDGEVVRLPPFEGEISLAGWRKGAAGAVGVSP